jgi:hypothetical protein
MWDPRVVAESSFKRLFFSFSTYFGMREKGALWKEQ